MYIQTCKENNGLQSHIQIPEKMISVFVVDDDNN